MAYVITIAKNTAPVRTRLVGSHKFGISGRTATGTPGQRASAGWPAQQSIKKGGSRGVAPGGNPHFLLCRPAGRSPSPGGRKAFPVPGRLGLFRAPKGNFCYSTKTSGEQILFSERAFDTVYDTVF